MIAILAKLALFVWFMVTATVIFDDATGIEQAILATTTTVLAIQIMKGA